VNRNFLRGYAMRLASTLLILFAAGVIAADDPKKNDADSLKGKWSAVSIAVGGKPMAEDYVKSFILSLDDKTYTNLVMNEVIEEGSYTIVGDKSPKTIDFDIKKGDDAGKKQLGIYKIDADKLTIVAAKAGAVERPKSFQVEAGSDVAEIILEKVKP
jgi:uncharacterized protein (TIGR03067 family)